MQSIKSVLEEAANTLVSFSESTLLDAEVLLCLVLDKQRSYLRAWPDKALEPVQITRFWQLIEKRQKGIPIAYITGSREFWSRDFYVTSDVLIPRPDTELLIELSLMLIPKDKPVRIIDLGTGSGIIAITLAAECPNALVSAVDFSSAALDIARQNAVRHHLKNIRFYQSDWFVNIPDTAFDLIVSNPPYIAPNDYHLNEGDLRFEPQSALIADQEGLSDITMIVSNARQFLATGGHLLIEHGYNQQRQVQNIFQDFHYTNVKTYPDLAGQPRVTYGQWNTAQG